MDHIDQTDVTGEDLAPFEPIPSFLAGLTQAMHETASRERGRMAAVVAEDARTHVEKARARAVVEAGELRRSAEEEVAAINAWSAAEIGRIRDEGVAAIFPEAAVSQRLEQAISREADARVGGKLWTDTLGPEGSGAQTYVAAMEANAATLAEGMSGGRVRCDFS